MSVIDDLLATLPDGPVLELCIGAFWTAVVVEADGHRRCGLASTLRNDDHHHGGGPAVRNAGSLAERSAGELAALARSDSVMEAAMPMAAVNALLPPREADWTDINAEEVIAEHGAGKQVALVGHFPFIPLCWKPTAQRRSRLATMKITERQEPNAQSFL